MSEPTAATCTPPNLAVLDSPQSRLPDSPAHGNGKSDIANSPVPAAPVIHKRTRNGKIARLPKVERDMVCRMLRDGVAHKTIVEALGQHDITVTVRNVSNFRTRGGYDEWRFEQERVLETHLAQEALTDYLGESPNELPEVGLQIAATRLSRHLTRPDVQQKLETNPEQFFPLVTSLCRLSKEILNLQKFRDARQTPGNPGYSQQREKEEDRKDAEITRAVYTRPPIPNISAETDILPPMRQR